MLVKRAEMFPVECVVRGYLTGSGLKDYQSHWDGLRHSTATWVAGRLTIAGTAVHPFHQGGGR